MTGRGGPPEKEAGPLAKGPANAEGSNTNTSSGKSNGSGAHGPGKTLVWVPCTRSYPQDPRSQLERRREAARRLPRICDRCSASDPLQCRCWNPDPPLSDHALDAWRAAIERTLPIGAPVVPLEVLQLLYRRNRDGDRELALRVWEQTGGLVA